MRKLVWLTAFAAAALFFGAPENAFAHPNHFHAAHTQNAPAVNSGAAALAADHVVHADEFVSSAELPKEKCRHGHPQSECDACCACSASASAAIVTPENIGHAQQVRSEGISLAVSYRLRQAILDLSRPPKSFA